MDRFADRSKTVEAAQAAQQENLVTSLPNEHMRPVDELVAADDVAGGVDAVGSGPHAIIDDDAAL